MQQFDDLTDDGVRWTPFTDFEVIQRAPAGLSTLCKRDSAYWMTRRPLVFDIFVEEYAVHRVMRQFGLFQTSPLPIRHTITSDVHRYWLSRCYCAYMLLPNLMYVRVLQDVA